MFKTIFALLTFLALPVAALSQHNQHSRFYYQRESLFDVLEVDSTDIVFLGNSITNGCEWHELLGMPNVLNRGISGDIVAGIEDRLESVVKGQPAKIFLMIGVNDVSHELSADSISTSIMNLVHRIKRESPRTKLYVQSLLPINDSYNIFKKINGKSETIRHINEIIEPQVKNSGATWINLYPAFCDENSNLRDDFTNDGLHLTGKGYLLWRDLIIDYVTENSN